MTNSSAVAAPSNVELMQMRKRLNAAGINTRGLAPLEICNAIAELDANNEVVQVPKPATKPATKPAPTSDNELEIAAQLVKLMGSMNTPTPTPILDEARIIELVKAHAPKPDIRTVEVKPFDSAAITGRVKHGHSQLERVARIVNGRNLDGTRMNVYCYGPAGSGKTTLAAQVAELMDLDFYACGAVLTPYELVGSKNAHGEYVEPALYKAFKHGGVFLLDEIDACSARALNCINQLLANDSYMFPNGELVKRHPDFICIAGANTKGSGATTEYVGRVPLDKATLDRFQKVRVDIDEKLELYLAESTYKANGGTTAKVARHWYDIVCTARKLVNKHGISLMVSPRMSQRGACLLALGFSKMEVVTQLIYDELPESQINAMKAALTPFIGAQ